MAAPIKFVTVQGARKTLRDQLTNVAHRILTTNPPGSIVQVLNAILATGLVSNARIAKEKNNSVVLRVEEAFRVSIVEIEGSKKIEIKDIRDVVTTKANDIFIGHKLVSDIKCIENLYESNGFNKPVIKTIRESKGKNYISLKIIIKESQENSLNTAKEPTRFRKEKRKNSRNAVTNSEYNEDVDSINLSLDFADSVQQARVIGGQISLSGEYVTDSNATSREPGSAKVGDEALSPLEEIRAYSSAWTGKFSTDDHIRTIRAVAPQAMAEIVTLIDLVEARRFNDPETENALDILKALHQDLGLLIDAVESTKRNPILVRIARKNAKLKHLIGLGAKLGLVAPALTIGISHMMSAITRVPIDSTMISTVFATMVAMPLVETYSKK